MNKYGRAAVEAVESCAHTPGLTPIDAWDQAAAKHFGEGTPAQRKNCPKSAFLGLCEAGYVRGIPPGLYTSSRANKKYAVDAVEMLREEPELAAEVASLWSRVLGSEKKQHNSQLDVVVALWRGGLLTGSEVSMSKK